MYGWYGSLKRDRAQFGIARREVQSWRDATKADASSSMTGSKEKARRVMRMGMKRRREMREEKKQRVEALEVP